MALGLGLALSSAAAAQSRALADDTALSFELVSQLGGTVRAVAATNEAVYLAAGHAVIVGRLSAGRHAGVRATGLSAPLPQPIEGLTFYDGHLYVAAGSGGLWVLDTEPIGRPPILGHVDTPGRALAVAVRDGWAYVADGPTGGLRVVDVADPAHPREVAAVTTPGEARDVAIAGQTVVVADGDLGVVVLDVADPRRPVQQGTLPSGLRAQSVAASGTLALIADPALGLQLLDVSDPRAASVVGALRIAGARHVVVAGTAAFVAADVPEVGGTRHTEVSLIDIGDPTQPQIIAVEDEGLPAADIAHARGAFLLATPRRVVGRRYLGGDWTDYIGGLEVPVEVEQLAIETNGEAVAMQAEWTSTVSLGTDGALGPLAVVSANAPGADVVAVHDDIVVTAGPTNYVGAGITVRTLRPAGNGSDDLGSISLDMPRRDPVRMAGGAGLLWVTSGPFMAAVSVRDPGWPYAFAPTELPEHSTDIATDGSVALVTTQTGVVVLDVTVPGQPKLLGAVTLPPPEGSVQRSAREPAVAGPLGLVRAPDNRLYGLDLSDPTAPRLGGVLPAGPGRPALVGRTAYIAQADRSLAAYDLGQPDAPRFIGSWPLRQVTTAIVAHDDRVVVGTVDGGLWSFTTSRVAAPVASPSPVPSATATARPSATTWPTVLPPPGSPTRTATPSATPPDVRPDGRWFLPALWRDG